MLAHTFRDYRQLLVAAPCVFLLPSSSFFTRAAQHRQVTLGHPSIYGISSTSEPRVWYCRENTTSLPYRQPDAHKYLKMAMEMVENMIRTRSLRRRSDRSIGSTSADGISFSKPLRAMSLRTSSLPLQVPSKSDLGRAAVSAIQCKGVPGIDGPPNLEQLSPMSYDELYASCDAMSSKTSVATSAKEPEAPISTPLSEEKQEKHEEPAADISIVILDSGALPGLQPSLPSAICPWLSLLMRTSSLDPNGSPTGADASHAGKPETVPVDDSLSNVVPAVPQAANVVRRKLTGYVGFANLPNQWHRKSVRKGFNFNVMVVGKFAFRIAATTCLGRVWSNTEV